MARPKRQEKPIQRNGDRPIYQQIQDLILHEIHQGLWKPGQAIDSVPTLVKRLGVSYATVCRAVDALVARGILVTRSGAGTYVAAGAMRRSVLWINGLSLSDGGISPYYLHCFATGCQILSQHHIEVDSIWIDRSDDPLRHPNLARGEIISRYSGVVLHACHPKHAVRSVLARLAVPMVDLFHNTPNIAMNQMRRLTRQIIRQWGQEESGPLVLVEHDVRYLPDCQAHGWEHLHVGDIGGGTAHEQWGYRMAWWRLQQGEPPTHWLILDDLVARGVTRAIVTHRARSADGPSHPWPRVVVACNDRQLMWHGFDVDYLMFDHRPVIAAGLEPFLGQMLGQPVNLKPARGSSPIAQLVLANDPRLMHLNPHQDEPGNTWPGPVQSADVAHRAPGR